MKDSEIVDLYWQRSEQAIQESVSKYGHYCRTVAENIVHNTEDVEECLDDTWFGAWNSMPKNRPSLLGPYLAKFTRWSALSRIRKSKSQKRGGSEVTLAFEELEGCVPSMQNVEREIELRELSKCIDAFLEGLEKNERCVFIERYWYVYAVSEIAKRHGFTESKVKSMLFRTRKKLSAFLEEEGLC